MGFLPRWSGARMAAGLMVAGMATVVWLAGAAPSALASIGCSWQTQYGNGGRPNLALDTSAAYWETTYLATLNSGMTITGSFPQARYMSFTLYQLSTALSGGHVYDAQIQPSTGVNPFQTGVSPTGTGTYTLHIVNATKPANPAPNTLYTGSSGAIPILYSLVYRVYDPDNSSSPAGGVSLPIQTLTLGGLPISALGPCVYISGPKQRTPAARMPAVAAGSAGTEVPAKKTASSTPAWTKSPPGSGFPDPDNSYLYSFVSQQYGQLIVVRAQMPTFPDTNAGAPAWQPGQQVRYWSMCEDNGSTDVVTGCAADYNSVQSGGVATFVVSTPANRPPNATAADGVNWIPWGSATTGALLYRQQLAQSSYTQSIADSVAGSNLDSMGPYLPQIGYCSEAEFASAGASGCLSS
jgi:hypothetical protein